MQADALTLAAESVVSEASSFVPESGATAELEQPISASNNRVSRFMG
jgi:hypothetical protein